MLRAQFPGQLLVNKFLGLVRREAQIFDRGVDQLSSAAQPRGGRCCVTGYRRGIKVRIARRGIVEKSKLGRHRWVVGRTVSWLLRFKRLGLRYDCTEPTLRSLLLLAVSMINLKRLIVSS